LYIFVADEVDCLINVLKTRNLRRETGDDFFAIGASELFNHFLSLKENLFDRVIRVLLVFLLFVNRYLFAGGGDSKKKKDICKRKRKEVS
jgi:dihydrofolate reductase